MYDPADMPAPRPAPASAQQRPAGALDQQVASGQVARWGLQSDEIAAMRANYAGNVTLIDEQIAGLVALLERRGELDRTVIAFTSDHGELNGDAGLCYKQCFLDGALRVPLLLRAPGRLAPGTVCASPVEWIDLGQTLVELAGGSLPQRQFSRSLLPVAAGELARDGALSEVDGECCWFTERWKLALNDAGEPYLLVDRLADPEERVNLVGDPEHVDVLRELSVQLLRRLASTQLRQELGDHVLAWGAR